MTITLVNIRNPHVLFALLHRFEGPVSCHEVDLHDPAAEHLICSMATPGRGIPQLELTVSHPRDVALLLRYMREGAAA